MNAWDSQAQCWSLSVEETSTSIPKVLIINIFWDKVSLWHFWWLNFDLHHYKGRQTLHSQANWVDCLLKHRHHCSSGQTQLNIHEVQDATLSLLPCRKMWPSSPLRLFRSCRTVENKHWNTVLWRHEWSVSGPWLDPSKGKHSNRGRVHKYYSVRWRSTWSQLL